MSTVCLPGQVLRAEFCRFFSCILSDVTDNSHSATGTAETGRSISDFHAVMHMQGTRFNFMVTPTPQQSPVSVPQWVENWSSETKERSVTRSNGDHDLTLTSSLALTSESSLVF